MLAVGLMSGTSLDGIDAALVKILPRGKSYCIELVRFATIPFEAALRQSLLAVLPPNAGNVRAVAQLHDGLGAAYARAARAVVGEERIDYVASHGQTVWHDGAAHLTLQLGNPFAIRERLRATVCYDFRSADCAAGGQGAPLVAYVDALLLASASEDRVALNIGGIANATLLRAGASPDRVVAFDTGPGNMLVDALESERSSGERSFDRDGALAGAGCVDATLLDAMLADTYFAASPPKTTGRERFGAHFLSRFGEALARLSLEDAAATLTELTAASIAEAIARCAFNPARVIVSGGGARNRTLVARIAARLAPAHVESSDTVGLAIDAKEAIAFAVLGYETLRERAANVPAATGAARRVVLGAIVPHDLRELLERVTAECTKPA
jgi:anhydro-N-acetylmuramic acid kinase